MCVRALQVTFGESGNVYRALTNAYVRRTVGFAESKVELSLRRLKKFQRVCLNPEVFKQWLAAMFGQFGWDDGAEDYKQHSHYLQLMQDLQCCVSLHSLDGFSLSWLADPLLLLQDKDARTEFGTADLCEIRQKVTSHSVPPPGWVSTEKGLQQAIVITDHQDQSTFVCVWTTH